MIFKTFRMLLVCDVEIRAPRIEYSGRAQEIHIKIIHALIDSVEQHST